ncbi:uncharacterized protein LAESUDRAFT_696172 [Laetiporus sulphureus 93-53]|uniref:C2H2-type domain-containing protein n=1 Tax=Laetiporus sulphureus 93-53 TaxID=1314785 RepID=A0A165FTU4_9APHY|nr:uncharacterized protein LAESUDRAFT_696172 [Laetiporus sulphureus 93-53]KZT09404.1 hypothetical protein LAESUDRAFT_696172 [Laetiporus sulphureus 93-53]
MSLTFFRQSEFTFSHLQCAMSTMPACCWETCTAVLDDVTPAGITRHLKDRHLDTWKAHQVGRCRWRVPNGVPANHGLCNRDMKYASFGKHIASVHLKSTVRFCMKCNMVFSRPDALVRHWNTTCDEMHNGSA